MTTPFTKAAVLEILRTPTSVDTFPDMIRRVEALEGCGVRVKELEWDDFEGLGAKASGFYQANYLIQKWSGECRFEVAMSYPGYQTGYDGPRWHPTLEAAKAAAQADYEARILAALEPVAHPETGPGELLPCPFCGGTDMYWPHGTDPAIIECGGKHGCGARSGVPEDQTEAEAIAAWNRRAAREPGTEPTPGQFTTMCLAIEDVVTGRVFDVEIPEEVKAYLRNVLMVGGWRGECD